MNRSKLVDLYFAEARSELIDLAAFLDRIERSEGADDYRMKAFRAALIELAKPAPERTKTILRLLSDSTDAPIPEAAGKSAAGAWPGY